jgi:hypothetical protein
MPFYLTDEGRARMKEHLIRLGRPSDESASFSERAYLRLWMGTNEMPLYPYRKLVRPDETVPALGLFPSEGPDLELVPLSSARPGRGPFIYRLYRHRVDGRFYLWQAERKDGGGGPVLMGGSAAHEAALRAQGNNGSPWHIIPPGGGLKFVVALCFRPSLDAPIPSYPVGTLSQKGFVLEPLELAEWLDAMGYLHPVCLKEALYGLRAAPAVPISDKAAPQAPEAVITFHGERRYSIGGSRIFVLEEKEDNVLQAFLDQPCMDSAELVEKAGFEDAPRILRNLRTKHDGIFDPAITCPGGRGKGGYHVAIRRYSSE